MNLYFRLLLVLIKGFFSKKITVDQQSTIHFRAWPLDCDINFHMTASRYHAITDLARVYLISQLRLMRPLLKRGWLPVIKTQVMTFHRSISPFQKFAVRSRLVSWSGTSLYIEQEIVANGVVYASTMIKGAFVSKKGSIPTSEIAQLLGNEVNSPPLDDVVEQLNRLIATRKQHNL